MTNKAQLVTRGIVNCRCSAGFKAFALIKVRSNLIGKCFEMPNASYTNRYVQAKQKTDNK